MRKAYAILLGALVLTLGLYAQEKPAKTPYKLTHHMTPEEKLRIDEIGKGFMATDPPDGPVRQVAEYETMQGVLIRYPFGISLELIAEMSEDDIVTTIVEGQSQENYVSNLYINNGVNLNNCNFLHAPSDSYWTRDYGPWYIFDGYGDPGIVNFIYNRPRPDDDAIPEKMAQFLNINYFAMDLVHAGGNYMTDGMGISSSSDLVWVENPSLTHQQIDQMVLDYCGVNSYHVVPDPNNTYIDHIDCWGKFLDHDKVLIRSVPDYHPQYDDIEATADYYAAQTSSYGVPFEVYRVFTPNNEPYTNSLILNDKVLVPITGSQWDDEAIATYEEAMPGYEVLGFTGSWESTDALHCRTKGIADVGMLYIDHMPLLGNQPVQQDHEIIAGVTAHSGQTVISDSVRVFYKLNGGSYTELLMSNTTGNEWSATIPAQPEGTEIAYYIAAADQSDRSATHPIIGQPDPHVFYSGMPLYPSISLDPVAMDIYIAAGDISEHEILLANNGQGPLNFNVSWSTELMEDHDFTVDNSPSQSSYDYNTYSELGWTDLPVAEDGIIGNITVDFYWNTDNYPEEGSFHIESPAGTETIIASGIADGNYTIELDDFNGEEMDGNWKLWIEDTYGDGGHRATDVTLTLSESVQIDQWLTVAPDNGNVDPGSNQNLLVTCDATNLDMGDYPGTIAIASNDPDNEEIVVPVTLHVGATAINEAASAIDSFNAFPNPFMEKTNIAFTLQSDTDVVITVFDVSGQVVRRIEQPGLTAGKHTIALDGNNAGESLSPGIYMVQVQAGNSKKVIRLICR